MEFLGSKQQILKQAHSIVFSYKTFTICSFFNSETVIYLRQNTSKNVDNFNFYQEILSTFLYSLHVKLFLILYHYKIRNHFCASAFLYFLIDRFRFANLITTLLLALNYMKGMKLREKKIFRLNLKSPLSKNT